MRISSQIVCALATLLLFFELQTLVLADTALPQVPETSAKTSAATTSPVQTPELPDPKELLNQLTKGDGYPTQIIIPSIELEDPVINVGVNEKGEMDVPDGRTKNIGWFEKGTVPGEVGSAVMDAHVYAAFKNLRYVKVGDPIYVKTRSGKILHFRVEDSRVFVLEELQPGYLFSRKDKKRLTLVTCAGKYIPSRETYAKRLVVSAVLVDE